MLRLVAGTVFVIRLSSIASVLLSSLLAGGCGATLPTLDVARPADGDFADFVTAIAAHVRCETAIAALREYDPGDPKRRILPTWAAKVALNIKAFDKGNLNPTVQTFNPVQDFIFSAGATVETNATREVTITYFIPFEEVFRNKSDYVNSRNEYKSCDVNPDVKEPIAGSLGIYQSLHAAFSSYDSNRVLSEDLVGGPFDTITHHVNFVVQAGINLNPRFNLVQVTVNPAGTLASASRAQTNDLLITFGPTVLGTKKLLKRGTVAIPLPSPSLNENFNLERLRTTFSGNNFVR